MDNLSRMVKIGVLVNNKFLNKLTGGTYRIVETFSLALTVIKYGLQSTF